MKTNLRILTAVTVLCAGLFTIAAAEKKVEAGPKGGRLLDKTSPKAEFFVEKDRTVSITFYDDKLQPVPVGNQVVTVIAEAKSGKARLELARKDGRLVSRMPLPEGEGYLIVVMIKAREDAKSQNFRLKLETHVCGGCKRAEYACTCGH
ncbi:MAG TPA: hypothetical protein VJW76_09130 [Verrucomicrobiae bacterium]|nr:hypothetical protein [Verrucomicrobiae bacterium]